MLSGLDLTPREITDLSRILMVACGTSLNAGLVGQYAFEDIAHLPAKVEQAAEFRYRNPIILPGDLLLAISQSGETADTLAAVREAHQKGALVAGICNVVGSTVARETGRGVYIHAGPEISVASTKAFTCQVSVLLMLALKIARCRHLSLSEGRAVVQEIARLPDIVEATLERNDTIARLAVRYAAYEDAFFIGRGYLFPVAMEGALKLKEISYIHAEGYHAAEMKHGPIALLQENTPVVALLTEMPEKEKMLGNAYECKARNAPLLAVVNEGDEETARIADDVITVPPCQPYLAPHSHRSDAASCLPIMWRGCEAAISISPETSPRASPSSRRAIQIPSPHSKLFLPPTRLPMREWEEAQGGATFKFPSAALGLLPLSSPQGLSDLEHW